MTSDTNDHWDRVSDLFDAAFDLPASERPAFLDKACGDDVELRRELDERDSRLRQIVEFRFFAGMTEDEVAEVLGVSVRTVQRDWAKAKAWLYRELYSER